MSLPAPACGDCDGGDCTLCPWSGRTLQQIREEYELRDPDYAYRAEARTPPPLPAPAPILVLEPQPFATPAPCSACDCDLRPPMDPCFCTCHLEPSPPSQPSKPRQLDLFGGASS